MGVRSKARCDLDGRVAIEPQLIDANATGCVHQFKPLLDAVVMPLAARLPHSCVPELIGIAMVRVNVIDHACRFRPAFREATNAERTRAQERVPSLGPPMVITPTGSTATPLVRNLLLFLPGRHAGWTELFGALHTLKRQKATALVALSVSLLGMAYALTLKHISPIGTVQGWELSGDSTSVLLPAV
ncbi:hypothetical protein ACQZ61_04150 [Agrobacterium vitis]|uniref:hypothetical protein n=1 Tax=Agrobacterium vitis TaxID=373 RepID=UPI001F3E57CB|nr:hypothetical protein [Agrobacterium vitis]